MSLFSMTPSSSHDAIKEQQHDIERQIATQRRGKQSKSKRGRCVRRIDFIHVVRSVCLSQRRLSLTLSSRISHTGTTYILWFAIYGERALFASERRKKTGRRFPLLEEGVSRRGAKRRLTFVPLCCFNPQLTLDFGDSSTALLFLCTPTADRL